MTFIDWSDSEGLFGLLLDFVADEIAECQQDTERQRWLSELLTDLKAVAARFAEIRAYDVIQELRDIRESVLHEFAGDPVTVHLQDCIEELEGLAKGA